MDDIKRKIATNVYNSIVSHLQGKGYALEREDDNLTAYFQVETRVLPITLAVTVNADKQSLMLIATSDITFQKDKLADAAIATCVTNCQLVDGGFEFDYATGKLVFRVSSSFKGCVISTDVFDYLFRRAYNASLTYCTELAKLAKGEIDLGAYVYYTEEL